MPAEVLVPTGAQREEEARLRTLQYIARTIIDLEAATELLELKPEKDIQCLEESVAEVNKLLENSKMKVVIETREAWGNLSSFAIEVKLYITVNGQPIPSVLAPLTFYILKQIPRANIEHQGYELKHHLSKSNTLLMIRDFVTSTNREADKLLNFMR